MFHRMLSILLIGATLFGPSICCCTMKGASAESSAPACCCCEQDSAAKQCPDDSGGNSEHDCPCRKHRAVVANLVERQILPTSPSVKWMLERPGICSPAFFLSADEMSPQRMQLPPCRFGSTPTGTEILIAHSVRRC